MTLLTCLIHKLEFSLKNSCKMAASFIFHISEIGLRKKRFILNRSAGIYAIITAVLLPPEGGFYTIGRSYPLFRKSGTASRRQLKSPRQGVSAAQYFKDGASFPYPFLMRESAW